MYAAANVKSSRKNKENNNKKILRERYARTCLQFGCCRLTHELFPMKVFHLCSCVLHRTRNNMQHQYIHTHTFQTTCIYNMFFFSRKNYNNITILYFMYIVHCTLCMCVVYSLNIWKASTNRNIFNVTHFLWNDSHERFCC